MGAIRAVAFDKDGTLFDFRATWGAWSRALVMDLAGGATDFARTLGAAVGYDVDTGDFALDSPVISHTPPEIAERLLPYLPGTEHDALVDRMNRLAAGARMAEAVPLTPLLGTLRTAGLKIGLVTNDAEVPARAHLVQTGIANFFDFVAGCDSGFGGKPAPGQLLAFAERVGVAPEQVIMVGDSRHDLVAGRAAGMRTVGVLTGIAGADELRPLADAVLPDIGHLPGWIAAQGVGPA